MIEDLRSLVTIITALHPAHFVPSTAIVEFTNRGVRRMRGMMHCRQILCCDGHYPSSSESERAEYERFKARLADLCRKDPFFYDSHILQRPPKIHGSRRNTLAHNLIQAFESGLIETPFVFLHQPDRFCSPDADSQRIVNCLCKEPQVAIIHLMENNLIFGVDPQAEWYRAERLAEPNRFGLPLWKTGSYTDHEHFGRVSYYRDIVFPYTATRCRPPHHCLMERTLPRPQEGIYLYLPPDGSVPHVNIGTKAHWAPDELGGKGVLASDLKLLRYFGIDPSPYCEGLVDITVGPREQTEYETFLASRMSHMRVTRDQQSVDNSRAAEQGNR
jgi:hypothetical protein